MFPDHYEIVKESLQGARSADEQILASVAVLADRLQRVKKLGSRFSCIEFSPAVQQLVARPCRAVVG